jgi:hypothetical protein
VAGRVQLRKTTDYEAEFWYAGGIGYIREEVWVDEKDVVVRSNLAFLLPQRSGIDNGRMLGFDNAHGIHERHYMDDVREVPFIRYAATANRF